jgi:hypothetical protein
VQQHAMTSWHASNACRCECLRCAGGGGLGISCQPRVWMHPDTLGHILSCCLLPVPPSLHTPRHTRHTCGPSQEPAKGVDAARAHALQAAAGASPELTAQPAFLAGGTLRQYQLQGLNWMMFAWLKVGVVGADSEVGALGGGAESRSRLLCFTKLRCCHTPVLVF